MPKLEFHVHGASYADCERQAADIIAKFTDGSSIKERSRLVKPFETTILDVSTPAKMYSRIVNGFSADYQVDLG